MTYATGDKSIRTNLEVRMFSRPGHVKGSLVPALERIITQRMDQALTPLADLPTRLIAAKYLRGLILGSTDRTSLLCTVGPSLCQCQHADCATEFKRLRVKSGQMILMFIGPCIILIVE